MVHPRLYSGHYANLSSWVLGPEAAGEIVSRRGLERRGKDSSRARVLARRYYCAFCGKVWPLHSIGLSVADSNDLEWQPNPASKDNRNSRSDWLDTWPSRAV